MAVVPPGYANVVIGGTGSPISIAGAGGGGGQVYTSSGTGASWASSTSASMIAKGQLKVEGEQADIFINGKSMSDWMSVVERRLAILQPRPELLEKYEALQNLYEQYKTLEALIYETPDVK